MSTICISGTYRSLVEDDDVSLDDRELDPSYDQPDGYDLEPRSDRSMVDQFL